MKFKNEEGNILETDNDAIARAILNSGYVKVEEKKGDEKPKGKAKEGEKGE